MNYKLGTTAHPFCYDFKKPLYHQGGAVAEWSKALLVREINENQKDPWFAPRPGQLLKKRSHFTLGIIEPWFQLFEDLHYVRLHVAV